MRYEMSLILVSSLEEIEMSLYATVGKVGREGDSNTVFKTSFFSIVEFLRECEKIRDILIPQDVAGINKKIIGFHVYSLYARNSLFLKLNFLEGLEITNET